MKKLLSLILLLSLFAISVNYFVLAEAGAEPQVEIIDLEDLESENNEEWVRQEIQNEFEKIGVQLPGIINFRLNWATGIKVFQPDLEEINSILQDSGNDFTVLNDIMIMSGSRAIIGLRHGSQFGGYRMQGQLTSINVNGDDYNRAELSFKYSGFLFRNGIYTGAKTDIAAGFVMGRGLTQLNLIYGIPRSMAEGIGSGHQNIFEKTFVFFEPQITVHRKIASFVGAELTLSYLLCHDLGENWTFAGQSIEGPSGQFGGPGGGINFSFGF